MSWLHKWFVEGGRPSRVGRSFRPTLEQLEGREMLSASPVTFSLQSNGNLLQVDATGKSAVVDQNVKAFQIITTPTGQSNLFDLHTNGLLRQRDSQGNWINLSQNAQVFEAFADQTGQPTVEVLGLDGSLSQYNVNHPATSSGWQTINSANVQWMHGLADSTGKLTRLLWLTNDGTLWQVLPSGVRSQVRSQVKNVAVFNDGKGGTMLVLLGKDGSLWLQQVETGWQFNVVPSGVTWAQGAPDGTGTLAKLYWLTGDGKLWQMDQSGTRKVIDQAVQSVTLDAAGSPQVIHVPAQGSSPSTPSWANIGTANVQWQQGLNDSTGKLIRLLWLTNDGVLWQVVPSGTRTQLRSGVKSVQVFGDGKGGTMLVLVGLDSSLWLQQLDTGWQFNVVPSGVSWASALGDSKGVLTKLYWLATDGKLWLMDQSGARTLVDQFVQAVTLDNTGTPHATYDQIGQYWNTLGRPSWLGVPQTATLHTPDGTGLYARFSTGEIMWTPAGGIHAISGAIYTRWLQSDGTASALGAPLSDVQQVPGSGGSQMQVFQNGTLVVSSSGVVSVTPFGSLLSGLPDAGLRTLSLDLMIVDGQLSRLDVIKLFRAVETDGVVSANEMTSLQQLLTLANKVNMPVYVQDLAGKIINGDPANQAYQGSQLGNLGVGSSAASLEKLVDKWFFGSDHPNPTDDNGNAGYHYQLVSGPLFHAGNTVSYGDIVQGMVGDCYFLSALADLAVNQPAALVGLFIDNHDGLAPGEDTYTIRFWNPVKNAWTYETVDQWLPVDASGRFAFANYQQMASDPSKVLWVALLEKGYAQANESGWLGGAPSNSYHGISTGWPVVALLSLTGKTGSHTTLTSAASVIADWNSKGEVSFNSTTAGGNPSVVTYHAYSLVGYDPTTGIFTLYNPWGLAGGYTGSQFKPGTLKMTWTQLMQTFSTWDGLS
jgi:Calpain family cysteine protease/LGFP repeat